MAAGIRTRHGRSCRSREGGVATALPPTKRGSTRSATERRSARLPRPRVREGVAVRRRGSCSQADAPRPDEDDGRRGRGGVAAGRTRGDGPQPLRRPLQTERPARLRALPPPPGEARARPRPAGRRDPRRRAGSGGQAPGGGARPEHHPEHAQSPAGDLPTGAHAGAGRGEPDGGARDPGVTRPARSNRRARRRGRADRVPAGWRPSFVGDGDVRGASTRRAARAPMGAH